MENKGDNARMTFWDHLDELRTVIVRCGIVVVVFAVVAFIFKDELFGIVLAPRSPDFLTYRFLDAVSARFGGGLDSFSVDLINTGLAGQFLIHIKVALCAGVLCASPYILYQLFRFVSPALYADERRYATRVVCSGYLMFTAGVLLGYFLIFPLTFRFLGTYQVAGYVNNLITLESYISTMMMLCLTLGLVFEMPVIIWLFGKTGLISREFLKRYRRHALVIIMIVAAIITPTQDVVTLLLVTLPIWILYEGSIRLVR